MIFNEVKMDTIVYCMKLVSDEFSSRIELGWFFFAELHPFQIVVR